MARSGLPHVLLPNLNILNFQPKLVAGFPMADLVSPESSEYRT